ncbi:hypothetical protein DRN73_09915 [Candidatus Pacearchaeota archaeon]|nr:MAG: hypothetical protein DRN73_09915 [Candidatus Pacearchaeota archaeon]
MENCYAKIVGGRMKSRIEIMEKIKELKNEDWSEYGLALRSYWSGFLDGLLWVLELKEDEI